MCVLYKMFDGKHELNYIDGDNWNKHGKICFDSPQQNRFTISFPTSTNTDRSHFLASQEMHNQQNTQQHINLKSCKYKYKYMYTNYTINSSGLSCIKHATKQLVW